MNANLYEVLRSHFAVALDREFLAQPGQQVVTYRAIDDRSARIGRVLRERGVNIGDRVVVQVDKSADAVALYLACLRIGAIYVPLNTAYVDSEVQFFINDAEPGVVVRSDGKNVLHPQGLTSVELSELADAADPWLQVETRLADDIAAILYTSGTTGRSKGAMLTHANLTTNALSLHAIWRFEPGDVLLHTLPIFHVHGLFVALHTAMLNASTVIFLPAFDPQAVLDALPDSTVMMGVPTHYVRLLDAPDFTRSSCDNMRLFTSGSAPMTELVHEQFTERTGHTILERYGMTEAGMITSNPYDGARVPGTVGFALPAVDIRVRDSSGSLAAPGETGVVEMTGPNRFSGYWRLEDQTADALTDDGWLITGDVGHVDEESRLTLEGRASDMIISGGLNVYPKEIELLLDEIDGVSESAVIGVPHPDFGEAVVAVVVGEVDPEALRAALDHELARFKHPKAIHPVETLPRNAMGKVQKSVLREQFGATFS